MYDWTTRKESQEAQKRFLEAERAILEQRRNGSLAQAIDEPLPDESPEELWWLVIEDQHLAEEGLVELRSGEEVWHKHIDELSLEDRPARLEAESTRRAWLMQRLTEEAEDTGQRL